MAMPWEGIVSADEIAAYEAAGFGRPQAQGKRPALLIIDVQYRTVGTQRQPFWESIKEFKTSCGEVGWKAVDHIAPLLALFREKTCRCSTRMWRPKRISMSAVWPKKYPP